MTFKLLLNPLHTLQSMGGTREGGGPGARPLLFPEKGGPGDTTKIYDVKNHTIVQKKTISEKMINKINDVHI